MAKVTMIELEIPRGRQSFPIEQADGILRMKFHGNWKLPEDSEWTWTAERGFEKKVEATKTKTKTKTDCGSDNEDGNK